MASRRRPYRACSQVTTGFSTTSGVAEQMVASTGISVSASSIEPRRVTDRERHRRKQAALDTLKREERDVGGHDDDQRKEDRAFDFERRVSNRIEDRFTGKRFRVAAPPGVEGVHHVLHHHQCAVHDDAEVERAEAQQVRRNTREVHADEGKQQRQRDRDGGQQRRADAAEKQNNTPTTMTSPSMRVCETVCSVLLTRSVRS